MWEGNIEISLFLSFVSGIIYDTINKSIPGFSSIIFLIIVYINSFYKVRSFFIRNILVFIFSLMYFIILPMKIGEGFMWNKQVILKYSLIFAILNVIVEYFVYLGKILKWKRKDFFTI